jgi:outer membrane protein TolC
VAAQNEDGGSLVIYVPQILVGATAAVVLTATAGAQQPITAVTLNDALRRARIVSPSVVNAQGSTRSAELATRSAIWQFIPALTLQPQANLVLSSGQSRVDPITGEIISGNQSNPSYSFGLTGTYTLFDGFARNHALREQQANEAAAIAVLTGTTFASDFTATDAFFTALADQQLVVVAQSNLSAANAQLNLASAKLHAGSGRLSDSLTALGTFLQARLGVLQARSNLVVGESNLGRLVGVPGRVAAIDDSAFYRAPPAIDTAAIRQEAMTTSPSIKSLVAAVVAAQQAWKATKATYFPVLFVSAGESWTGNQASNYSLVARRNLNLGFTFSPWTSLSRETLVENAAIRITGADAALADQRNFLAAQLNQAFAALATAEETIAVSQASVTTGELNLRVVTDQYRIGGATITDVLTAQQQLVAAQGSEVQARYSYLRSRAQLESILGRKL